MSIKIFSFCQEYNSTDEQWYTIPCFWDSDYTIEIVEPKLTFIIKNNERNIHIELENYFDFQNFMKRNDLPTKESLINYYIDCDDLYRVLSDSRIMLLDVNIKETGANQTEKIIKIKRIEELVLSNELNNQELDDLFFCVLNLTVDYYHSKNNKKIFQSTWLYESRYNVPKSFNMMVPTVLRNESEIIYPFWPLFNFFYERQEKGGKYTFNQGDLIKIIDDIITPE